MVNGYQLVDLGNINVTIGAASGHPVVSGLYNLINTATKPLLVSNYKVNNIAKLPAFMSFQKKANGDYAATLFIEGTKYELIIDDDNKVYVELAPLVIGHINVNFTTAEVNVPGAYLQSQAATTYLEFKYGTDTYAGFQKFTLSGSVYTTGEIEVGSSTYTISVASDDDVSILEIEA